MTAATEPFEMPDDLGDELEGPEPDWDSEPEAPPDATRADSMIYRLRSVTLARARDQKVAAARVQQVQDWLDRRETAYDRQEAWLRAALRRYHEAVLALDPKRLSISLPSGDLVSRLGQREWVVDDVKVLGWAFPEAAATTFDEALLDFRKRILWICDNLSVQVEAIRVTEFPKVELSRKGLKDLGTRRDEKDQAVAWGVAPDGEKIPGVTIVEPERNFNVVFPEQQVPDEPFPPYKGGLTVEDDR